MLRIFTYFIILQLSLIKLIFVISTPIKILEKGILPLERDSVAIQFYLDLENEDKSNVCILNSRANKCCLIDKEKTDCDSVKVLGEYDNKLNPKDRNTYLFFYPTLIQLNHQGYCDFGLIKHCGERETSEEIRIPFDTRLFKKQTRYLLRNFKGQKATHCEAADEDPLNGCGPIDCDIKYSGVKPFYSKTKHRCVEAAECIANPKKQLPDIVYEPISNTCKDLDHPLSIGDIYAINTGLGVTIQPNISKENEKLMVYMPNCSTISQNVLFLRDMFLGKLGPVKGYTLDFKQSCNYALWSIFSCIIITSATVLLFVCCVNLALWFCKEWKSGIFKKKVNNLKSEIKTEDIEDYEDRRSTVNKDITNKLLREVIVSDLPLELRNSVIDICERIGKEVRWKKRYRMKDLGSDINLRPVETSDTSTTSDLDTTEKERFLK